MINLTSSNNSKENATLQDFFTLVGLVKADEQMAAKAMFEASGKLTVCSKVNGQMVTVEEVADNDAVIALRECLETGKGTVEAGPTDFLVTCKNAEGTVLKQTEQTWAQTLRVITSAFLKLGNMDETTAHLKAEELIVLIAEGQPKAIENKKNGVTLRFQVA